VAEGGTGATSTSAARTSLGLVIGTNVLAPNGSAASLTNLPAAGASAVEAANIMINSFNIAAAGGFAYQNMVDGVVDEFEDETGIDTSTSTNETYDATSDFYSGISEATTPSASGQWEGTTGNFTFTGDDIDDNGANAAIRLIQNFSGDFTVNFTYRTGNAGGTVGVFATSEEGTWVSDSSGAMGSMTNSFFWQDWASNYTFYGGGGNLQTINYSDTDTFEIGRVGSTITIKKNDVNQHVFSQTYSGEMTFTVAFSSGGGGFDIDDVSYTMPGGGANMTLVSNATTALAAPDDANIVIWQQDVDSITLNTDLKAYASRNGGTTYTQMTLSEVANLTTGRILTGTVDISGQSSATAMKYKIETLNTKEQKIHAVALQWS